MSDSIPPRGSMGRPYSNLRIAEHGPVAADGGMVEFRWVTPGYFRTLGIPICRAVVSRRRARVGRISRHSERNAGAAAIRRREPNRTADRIGRERPMVPGRGSCRRHAQQWIDRHRSRVLPSADE
jgi:hypothetical protein